VVRPSKVPREDSKGISLDQGKEVGRMPSQLRGTRKSSFREHGGRIYVTEMHTFLEKKRKRLEKRKKGREQALLPLGERGEKKSEACILRVKKRGASL